VFGIARHKVADYFRRAGREGPVSTPLDETVPAESAPLSARELLRWAEQELPEAEHAENTLQWMMREAAGDKLESIAQEERVPAPRVRQRVARMRRHFRERWALAAAVVAVVVVGAAGIAVLELRPEPIDIVRETPSAEPGPQERASELRRLALEDCAAGKWQLCLDRLDQAAAVDPAGDSAVPIREARQRAVAGLAAPVVPSAAPTPTGSAQPTPAPTQSELNVPSEVPAPTKVAPKTKAFDSKVDSAKPRPPQKARSKGEEQSQGRPKAEKQKAAPARKKKAPDFGFAK
jgi:hypothetical protein